MIESTRAKQAWADYLALGPERSLPKLVETYRSGTKSVPTRQLSRLKLWSQAFDWQARLHAIADTAAKEAADREQTSRRENLESGFALAHERVRSLKEIAGTLYEELTTGGRLWVSEPKQLGAAVVDVERFNAREVEQFRGVLDDIARETGGRRGTLELTGNRGAPIAFVDETDSAARIASLLERVRERIALKAAEDAYLLAIAEPSRTHNAPNSIDSTEEDQ